MLARLIETLRTHTGIHRYTRNLGWMFFARIGTLLIGMLATMYIARSLGPTNYGELSYATSFSMVLGLLALPGIEQILGRELMLNPEKRGQVLGTALVVRAVSGSLAFVLTLLIAYITRPNDLAFMAIALISTSYLSATLHFFGAEFQADARSKAPSIVSVVLVLILNALKITTIALHGGVLYLASILALEPILYGATYIWLRTRAYGPITSLQFNPQFARTILISAFPLTLAAVASTILLRLDQVLLRPLMDAAAVGYYDAAVRISEAWYFVPNIIVLGLMPAIANAKRVDHAQYHRRMQRLLLVLIATTGLIALPATLLAHPLITFIFGNDFAPAVPVLRIYIWSNIAAAVTLGVQQFLILENKTLAVAQLTAVGAAANIILNLLLIPRVGILGSALATLISYSVPLLVIPFLRDTRILLRRVV